MPEKPSRPGWGTRNSRDPFGDHKQKKKKVDPETELKKRVAERKERIRQIIQNKKKVVNAKHELELSANKIEERVVKKVKNDIAQRIKGDITNTQIKNHVIREVNRLIDSFKIDFESCGKELGEDLEKYASAQVNAINSRILVKLGRRL